MIRGTAIGGEVVVKAQSPDSAKRNSSIGNLEQSFHFSNGYLDWDQHITAQVNTGQCTTSLRLGDAEQVEGQKEMYGNSMDKDMSPKKRTPITN